MIQVRLQKSYEQKIIEIQNIHIIPPDEFEKFKNFIESLKEDVEELNEKYENMQLNQNLLIRKVEKIEEKINLNKEVGLISEKYIPDTRCFIKRDQDEIILDKLVNKEDTDIIVLTGIGGIGKTILASYLANKLYDESNYKYKWFDSKNDLNEKYRLILEKEFNQFKSNKEYIINYLSNNLKDEKSNILFVFDNIENIEEIKDYILKLPSKVKIIITTRNQELKIPSLFRKSEKFALNTLDKIQAKNFLIEIEEIRNLDLSEEKLNDILNDLMPNNIITPFKLNFAVTLIADNETERLSKIIEILKNNSTEQVYIQLLIESFKDNKLPENILAYFSLLKNA